MQTGTKAMESSSSSSKPLILLVIVLPLLFSNPSSGQYLAISCDAGNVTYEINSPFHNNLILLLQSLSEKTVEYNGFYRTSYGDGSDKVNGRALCRGDVTPADCKTCLTNATRQLLAECKEQSAAIWLDECQIDYSYSSLVSDYGGKYANSEAEEEAGDRARFCDALGKMFPRLSEAAGRSELMFAYAKDGFSGKETLYGLVQCTRDIAPRTCVSCLDSAFKDFAGCDGAARGGAVLSRTCSLRFQLYRFFDDDDDGRKNKRKNMAIGVSVSILVVAIAGFLVLSRWRRSRAKGDVEKLQDNFAPVIKEEIGRFTPGDLPFMEFSVVEAATDNFSNKLGEGGFGKVYKGVMADGKEIAVKRLSKRSWQGSVEFMNEIGIIAKLQHRNLVRLLSCSLQGSEKLLIYEYVPNKSLDLFLFDREKRSMLDWNLRIKIITGIARGLVYLHEESRIKIVHRDLKPSNVLLDSDMSAKISDFGLARIFCDNQNLANTNRVVGTYGYMAPEYAMEGVFSVKSDVFSFGVMLLGIISGKRNNGFNQDQNLLAYAWEVWKRGEEVELVDPMLREKCPMQKVKRCIQIGLVCVQGDAEERPSMSQVVALLESQVAELPHPNKPAFSARKDAVAAAAAAVALEEPRSAPVNQFSVNQMTISSIMPR